MEIAHTVSLCLGDVEYLVLFRVSLEYVRRGASTYEIRLGNDSGHLILPDGCDGVESEGDEGDETFVGAFEKRCLCILDDVGDAYPWEIGDPRGGMQDPRCHEDSLSLDAFSILLNECV